MTQPDFTYAPDDDLAWKVFNLCAAIEALCVAVNDVVEAMSATEHFKTHRDIVDGITGNAALVVLNSAKAVDDVDRLSESLTVVAKLLTGIAAKVTQPTTANVLMAIRAGDAS